MKPARMRIWLWGVPLMLLAAGLLYLVVRPKTVEAEVVRVRRMDFVEVIRSEGVLRSRKRFPVSAFSDGDMRRMDHRVGDSLKKGQAVTAILWDLKYEPVRSPIRGVVSKVFRENAGPVRRGEVILEVVDPDDVEAVVELLTPDAARVRAGMPVLIESLEVERKFRGRVAEVSRAGFVKVSALGVEEERTEVRIELLDPIPAEFRGNEFHLEAAIEVARIPGARVIPIGAVFRDGEHWAVYRYDSGYARKALFESRTRSEGWQVVGSGLVEGDEILNFPGDQVREGVRIRRIRVEQKGGVP
jgi:HlyD family secretion protein